MKEITRETRLRRVRFVVCLDRAEDTQFSEPLHTFDSICSADQLN